MHLMHEEPIPVPNTYVRCCLINKAPAQYTRCALWLFMEPCLSSYLKHILE